MSLSKLLLAGALAVPMATGLGAGVASTASATTTLYGGVVRAEDGKTMGGASLYLYRYTGRGWQQLDYKAVANRAGSYRIGGLADGYWYSVRASKTFGICQSGLALYDGFSANKWGGGGSRPAKVVISFQDFYFC